MSRLRTLPLVVIGLVGTSCGSENATVLPGEARPQPSVYSLSLDSREGFLGGVMIEVLGGRLDANAGQETARFQVVPVEGGFRLLLVQSPGAELDIDLAAATPGRAPLVTVLGASGPKSEGYPMVPAEVAQRQVRIRPRR